MRKLKTTSEPLETTESALEMQQQAAASEAPVASGNTIILNPALHSAAANVSSGSSRLVRSRTAAKRPPALILTKDEDNAPALRSASLGANVEPGCSPAAGWKVTFPDIEIHSPKEDNGSISSRGTSSTVGYRYVR